MATTRATSEPDTIPAEDAWAYEPETKARILSARGKRGYRLSEEDIWEIVARMEAARAEGREYHPTPQELEELEAKHLDEDDATSTST